MTAQPDQTEEVPVRTSTRVATETGADVVVIVPASATPTLAPDSSSINVELSMAAIVGGVFLAML